MIPRSRSSEDAEPRFELPIKEQRIGFYWSQHSLPAATDLKFLLKIHFFGAIDIDPEEIVAAERDETGYAVNFALKYFEPFLQSLETHGFGRNELNFHGTFKGFKEEGMGFIGILIEASELFGINMP